MGAIMAVKSIVAVLGIALASTAAAYAQTQAPLAGTYDVSDEGLVKSLPGFISKLRDCQRHPTALCRRR
jgi:hypothetical protein